MQTGLKVLIIPERQVPGRRLGRHVVHDERSRDYDAAKLLPAVATRRWAPARWAVRYPTRAVRHPEHAPIWDQGDLGSCTGNAIAGMLMTGPFWSGRTLGEPDAVSIYSEATRIDPFPGSYPPEDTGSSGLSAAKACRARGWIGAYHHAFSLRVALANLALRPAIAGITWWSSFDEPGINAMVRITPNAWRRGGHEVCLVGVDPGARTVLARNSWGAGWGAKGYFSLSWDTLEQLMGDDGDITVCTTAKST